MPCDLQTNRLHLRLRTRERQERIFALPIADQLAYFGYSKPEQLVRERNAFEQGWKNYKMDMCWWEFLLADTDTVMGQGGYHMWIPDHCRAEIGYHLAPEYHRKGYMWEALNAMMDFGFTEMGLNRIEACIGPKNEPSIKLVDKAGFKREGLLREHYCKDGVAEDSLIYSLLKREYNPTSKPNYQTLPIS